MVARPDNGIGDMRARNGIGDVGAETGTADAYRPPRSLLASAATLTCWVCLGGGCRWRDVPGDVGLNAAHPIDRTHDTSGGVFRPVIQRGSGMDRANVFASQRGVAEKSGGRRIAWHLVGAAVALFVGLVSLSIAWAGATANYQARVEREQMIMLATPAAPVNQSSYVLATGWRGEVLLP